VTKRIGVCALIPAAGRGARFGGSDNKVFVPLAGRPLLGWTLDAFARCDAVDAIVLVGGEADAPRLREIGERYGGGKLRAVTRGGETRQESVRLGLAACGDAALVAVHDAARPCITPEIIDDVIRAAADSRYGATAAIPVSDTLVRAWTPLSGIPPRADGHPRCAALVSRDGLWAIQTPQCFATSTLRDAHDRAQRCRMAATDDMSLVCPIDPEHVRSSSDSGRLVPGSPENLKVTRPEDLAIAEAILTRRLQQRRADVPQPAVTRPEPAAEPPFRIGYGYDVHAFAEGRPLYLGGVLFPEADRGLLGHSDADVLLHAVCDALLGAAGLGDIGKLFPPSDARHKDRRSTEFLSEVGIRIRDSGWQVGNVDAMVLAEAPRVGPRVAEMRACIAAALETAPERISIKATTNEGMGFVGRGEGIAVHATALLMRRDGHAGIR
jgi:2-C-methyl-D-erythritol 2,4-cyclodiphosphate synthase/2-C-methyl-D-erythritol 4-phosphate cytidylyltransferase